MTTPHRLAITWDEGAVGYYFDGSLVGTATETSGEKVLSSIWMGDCVYDPFNGCIKNFRFSSTVHTAEKIAADSKLDELPQLYNVLFGSMSFVGPRPELLRYTEAYEGEEKQILEVRPGITDFSSIEFISLDEIVGTENADEMYEKYVLQRKNRLRIRYAQEVSLRTDVYLFFKTVGCALKKALRIARAGNGEKA